jgi:hypothetical protein
MQQRQIQQKQIKQQQMTQRQMTDRQMTPRQFTRQHNDHEHGMTIANPQKDSRQMFIPASTIIEEQPTKMRFGYLRSWFMGLLALLLLPLGALLILTGNAISNDLNEDWVATTAEVSRVDDAGIAYTFTLPDGTERNGFISRQWDTFVKPSETGDLGIRFNLCDVASLVFVPRQSGDDFNLWYDSDSPANAQCVPITQNAGTGFVTAGWVLVVFSLWILLGIFHRAGRQMAK